MPNLADWKADLDRWGLRRWLWLRVIIALRNRLVLCDVRVRVHDPEIVPLHSAGGCTIRFATRDDLIRACDDPRAGLNAADVATALDRGDVCTAAFDGDRMVAYVWRSFTTARWAPNVWVAFEKPYRYGHKGFTDPAYRGRRISTALSLFMDRECIDSGYTHAISLVETHNYTSLAAEAHRPSVHVGYAGYLKLRGSHYPFRTWGARKHKFRLRHVEDESNPSRVCAERAPMPLDVSASSTARESDRR